ncbi:MAG: hypothetical protein QOF02_921 [Blastocatellia bacterium]|jgi:hypothetical protein|nr:hypothetical protein [Blastocatellia bacterium]
MAEITVKHLGLKITIEGKFGGLSEQDLYTQAVVSLIRKAKIKEWQSRFDEAVETDDEDRDVLDDLLPSPLRELLRERTDDEDRDALDEFCSAVFIAVAHLYRAEDTYPDDKPVKTEKIGELTIPENDSIFGALLGIISNLGNIRGMLLGGDIRAEEPKDLN